MDLLVVYIWYDDRYTPEVSFSDSTAHVNGLKVKVIIDCDTLPQTFTLKVIQELIFPIQGDRFGSYLIDIGPSFTNTLCYAHDHKVMVID